jgi:CubicO group peptidase (beta-lactamase class C family)
VKATFGERLSHFPALPRSLSWPDIRHAGRLALGAGVWAVLMLFVVATAYFFFPIILAAVLLDSAPSTEEPIREIAAALVVVTAIFAFVVGRFVSSYRAVALAVCGTLALATVVGVTWARSNSDNALFMARAFAWSESDVKDYEKFPERAVANAGPVFNFTSDPSPELFQTITYTSGGEENQAGLEEFLESTNTTSFIVIKDDSILYEGYFNGYDRDSIVTSFSMAKSITSALVGIAIEEGYINSVDDPITDYIPELRAQGLEGMTIRHLLTMSSGIRYVPDDRVSLWDELRLFTDDTVAYYYPDLRAHDVKLHRDDTQIGSHYNYNNYLPQLLGMVLERTTHRPVSEYLQEKIWKPLGMEFPASWSLDSEESGFEKMDVGVNGRAIDFAKFGRLFLNEGEWNGQQIISRDWVVESTSPDPNDNRVWDSDQDWKDDGGYYKYFWWGMLADDGTYDYAAHGHLGQLIYIAPDEDVVIVRFGIDEGSVDRWDDVLASIATNLE